MRDQSSSTPGQTYGRMLRVSFRHVSITFASAAVLERHLGYRASLPMFAIAGYVSASRLTDNRHSLSDVLFGSALGMAGGGQSSVDTGGTASLCCLS